LNIGQPARPFGKRIAHLARLRRDWGSRIGNLSRLRCDWVVLILVFGKDFGVSVLE
jgi:hypothetical protein